MNDKLNAPLAEVDPLIASAIDHEVARQANGLELIASENFVSEAVLEAAGSVFTNKYAEGYPGKRYYGGCEWSDVVEQIAIDRAKDLFGERRSSKHVRLSGSDSVWRYDPRDESGARRTSDARPSAELFRSQLQSLRLWRVARNGND